MGAHLGTGKLHPAWATSLQATGLCNARCMATSPVSLSVQRARHYYRCFAQLVTVPVSVGSTGVCTRDAGHKPACDWASRCAHVLRAGKLEGAVAAKAPSGAEWGTKGLKVWPLPKCPLFQVAPASRASCVSGVPGVLGVIPGADVRPLPAARSAMVGGDAPSQQPPLLQLNAVPAPPRQSANRDQVVRRAFAEGTEGTVQRDAGVDEGHP